ncbi:MAG: hypothetical protein WCA49_00700 [Candidatus Sulfotelmatobacter sp.]
MDLKRAGIHEAGHFLVAFKYDPRRAVSIRVGGYPATDSTTGEKYVAAGRTITHDLPRSSPKTLVTIRAAGLAAESLVFGQTLESFAPDAEQYKTDVDNAKNDLEAARLPLDPDLWRMCFYDARIMLEGSEDKLSAIADYCLANRGREVTREELVAEIGSLRS